ncbi:hypothetical protein HYO31_13255 [Vibrio parahaemolyticus]|nr:hypothetical protein [Vibrio parahaemolyticus]
MQKVTSLIPIVVLLGLYSAGWIFLTGKSAFEFFTLLAFILAGIGLLAMVLLRVDPKHFNFVLDKVSECSGQQIPDTDLSRFSALTGDSPSLA